MQQAHTGMKQAESRTKDVEASLANSVATLLAAAAIALGVVGLLVAFGYINGDNSTNHFQDGMIWLVLGIISSVAANAFRREHHGVDAEARSDTKDVETWLANSLATLLAAAAIALGVVGLLVAFGYINGDSTNHFQDGMTWLVLGLISGIAANAFRRERRGVDSHTLSDTKVYRGPDETERAGSRIR